MANSALCYALFEQLFMDTVHPGFPNFGFQSSGTLNSKKNPQNLGCYKVGTRALGFRSYMGAIGYGLQPER